MTDAFEVIISQSGEQSESTAIANATNKLITIATELNISESDIFEVNVYDGDGGLDYGVGLCVAFSDMSEVTKESFLISLDNEETVESVEEVHYEQL